MLQLSSGESLLRSDPHFLCQVQIEMLGSVKKKGNLKQDQTPPAPILPPEHFLPLTSPPPPTRGASGPALSTQGLWRRSGTEPRARATLPEAPFWRGVATASADGRPHPCLPSGSELRAGRRSAEYRVAPFLLGPGSARAGAAKEAPWKPRHRAAQRGRRQGDRTDPCTQGGASRAGGSPALPLLPPASLPTPGFLPRCGRARPLSFRARAVLPPWGQAATSKPPRRSARRRVAAPGARGRGRSGGGASESAGAPAGGRGVTGRGDA